jgi:kynurenine formamidase
MHKIIDLSQEIFAGMPVFPGLPEVVITPHASHEQWDGITDSDVVTPAVNRLELGEHTGTHVDAIVIWHASMRQTIGDTSYNVLCRGHLPGSVSRGSAGVD